MLLKADESFKISLLRIYKEFERYKEALFTVIDIAPESVEEGFKLSAVDFDSCKDNWIAFSISSCSCWLYTTEYNEGARERNPTVSREKLIPIIFGNKLWKYNGQKE